MSQPAKPTANLIDAFCAWLTTLKPSERLIVLHQGLPPKVDYEAAVAKESAEDEAGEAET